MPRKNKHTQQELLMDYMLRHQVYLEGLKAGFALQYTKLLKLLYAKFVLNIDSFHFKSMDQFTRAQLEVLIKRFQRESIKDHNAYQKELVKQLKEFVSIDLGMTAEIMQSVKAVVQAKTMSVGDLWDTILKEPNPANGKLLPDDIRNFITNSVGIGPLLIRQAWANNWTVEQTKGALRSNDDDSLPTGAYERLSSQAASFLGTAIQSISAQTQAEESSSYFSTYQWVSVLDSRTTLICRARNGVIYKYGDGPLPPAHYNCRSKVVPLPDGVESHQIPESYYQWLKRQPGSFQNDVLGIAGADRLRAGIISAETFTGIHTTKPLTLSDFAAKIGHILGTKER